MGWLFAPQNAQSDRQFHVASQEPNAPKRVIPANFGFGLSHCNLNPIAINKSASTTNPKSRFTPDFLSSSVDNGTLSGIGIYCDVARIWMRERSSASPQT